MIGSLNSNEQVIRHRYRIANLDMHSKVSCTNDNVYFKILNCTPHAVKVIKRSNMSHRQSHIQ
jgi:hypothetical protein